MHLKLYIIDLHYNRILYIIIMIPKELIKGSIKSLILKLLKEHGRMYGYEITQKIELLTSGEIKLTFGALYPILHKLENDGIVTTTTEMVNNRARVYYNLTIKGQSTANEKIKELEAFIETLNNFLRPSIGLNNSTC